MLRYLLAAAVVVVDSAILVAAHLDTVSVWGIAGYALATSLVVAARYRSPVVAFALALVLATVTGLSFALLIWTGYQAGHAVVTRSGTAMLVGAAVGGFAVHLVVVPSDLGGAGLGRAGNVVVTFVIFVALPLLSGRYLAQHQRLVATLHEHNRQLRRTRELNAEQERLRERLRIARDMHDSLGRRLSLVTIQAAALEVSPLPDKERESVRLLAQAARDATDELHELVGALRGSDASVTPGVEAIDTLVADFRAAGVSVSLRQYGEPLALSGPAGSAAYRVVEEGLTNATRHAPGRPVSVTVQWQSDAVLLTVTNPIDHEPSGPAGYGLAGLRERVHGAGGLLDHRITDAEFRLFAMLPAEADEPVADVVAPIGRVRAVALAAATAAIMFVALPATLIFGVR